MCTTPCLAGPTSLPRRRPASSRSRFTALPPASSWTLSSTRRWACVRNSTPGARAAAACTSLPLLARRVTHRVACSPGFQLPVIAEDRHKLAFAHVGLAGKRAGKETVQLWLSLLEKAYAMFRAVYATGHAQHVPDKQIYDYINGAPGAHLSPCYARTWHCTAVPLTRRCAPLSAQAATLGTRCLRSPAALHAPST